MRNHARRRRHACARARSPGRSRTVAADRRPFARVAVQYPGARLWRSGHRRARARFVRRHRRARHRGDLARRGLSRCSSTTACRRARCCATMSSTLGLGGVTRIFRRDATKLGPVHPLEPFSLAFLDPPYGKGLAEKALSLGARRRLARRRARWSWWRKRRMPPSRRRKASRNWSGGEYDDTEFMFLRAA